MGKFSEIEKEMFNMLSEYESECRKNRYFPTCDLLDYIEKNTKSFEIVIPEDTIFYRARVYRNDIFEKWFNIGMEMKKATSSEEYNMYSNTILEMIEKEKRKIEEGFKGYDEEGSFVNPNTNTIESARCNNKYEVCLYVADDIETSISELKPLINESISVAEIIALEDLNVIDFSFDYERNDKKAFLKNLIALLFMTSPTEEKKEAYLYTQIMCSYIKKLGYDGICYTSCQNYSKLNYVIFNYSKCKAINSDVYSVESIKYEVRKKFQTDNNV